MENLEIKLGGWCMYETLRCQLSSPNSTEVIENEVYAYS